MRIAIGQPLVLIVREYVLRLEKADNRYYLWGPWGGGGGVPMSHVDL